MELWIRSQDKEILMNCKVFKVRDYEDKYRIYGSCDGIGIEPLGDYAKGERALEVLDEIQFLIYCGLVEEPDILRKIKENVKSGWYLNNKSNVVIFEMPKE